MKATAAATARWRCSIVSTEETMLNTLRLPLTTAALVCIALPAWGQQDYSEDKGKELAAALCNSCHPLTARTGSGYDAKGWDTVMDMMVNNRVPIPKDQVEPLKAYLIKAFPVKGRPDAVVVPGRAKVSMQFWQASTPGARPHDPLAARDGSLWYTGQMN